MGYTNYYHTRRQENDKFPAKFVEDVKTIVANSPCQIIGWDNDELESKPEITEDRIALNGAGENGHESFVMTPDGRNMFGELSDEAYRFCKTTRKPYDLIVKSILILAERRGDILHSNSPKFWFDGNRKDVEYTRAVRYLKKLKLI